MEAANETVFEEAGAQPPQNFFGSRRFGKSSKICSIERPPLRMARRHPAAELEGRTKRGTGARSAGPRRASLSWYVSGE